MNDAKRQFVTEYLEKSLPVCVLNRDFMEAYIEKFSPKWTPTVYGAPKCPEVGRFLALLFKRGILKRSRVGLSQGVGGFPSWVYVYSLWAFAEPAEKATVPGTDSEE